MRRISKPTVLANDTIHTLRKAGYPRDIELERLAGPQPCQDGSMRACEVYLLPSGRVAWVWGEEGLEFSAYDEFAAVVRETASRQPQHMLSDYPGFTEDFAERVPSMIAKLAGHLGLPPELSVGVDDFVRVADKIRTEDPRAYLAPGLFEPLVAYVGEHIRQRRRGTWAVRSSEGVFEPVVIVDGAPRLVFKEVYEALEEDDMVPREPSAS